MEKPCLNDKDVHPNDKLLTRALGKAKSAWDSFTDFLDQTCPAFSREWRYYNDGKSWLYKVTKKKKTICWVAVCPGMFSTTFYFPERAGDLIKKSKLAKKYLDQFANNKYGKTRGITVKIKKPADLAATKKLIEIKEQFK